MSYTYIPHTWITREIITADKMNNLEKAAEQVGKLKPVSETGSYNDLTQKPQINGIELSGNKTTTQIGLHAVAASGSYTDLKNKPQINGHELSGDMTAAVLEFATVATSGKYTDLTAKPQINGVELTGNKTAADLKFATVATSGKYSDLTGVPTNVSQFTNDAKYQKDTEVAATVEAAKTDIKKNTLGNLSFAVNAQDKGLDITYTY